MKTLEDWNARRDEPTLTEYLQPCDEIDEAIYDHMASIVPPQYLSRDLPQSGEAEREVDGIYFYMSFCRIGDRHYYLGVLPEFKMEE